MKLSLVRQVCAHIVHLRLTKKKGIDGKNHNIPHMHKLAAPPGSEATQLIPRMVGAARERDSLCWVKMAEPKMQTNNTIFSNLLFMWLF